MLIDIEVTICILPFYFWHNWPTLRTSRNGKKSFLVRIQTRSPEFSLGFLRFLYKKCFLNIFLKNVQPIVNLSSFSDFFTSMTNFSGIFLPVHTFFRARPFFGQLDRKNCISMEYVRTYNLHTYVLCPRE